MDKSEKTKEKILQQTIVLIKEYDGKTDKITIRKIAERSGVGIGLINHHFESKERLIENCVQKIINGVIYSFKPDVCNSDNSIEIVKCVAKQVMDFLMDNQQISRISIIGDLSNPKAADNTMGTVIGFAGCLSKGKPTEEDIRSAFMLTSILQESFLRKDLLKSSLGIDFYDKSERDSYIDSIIDKVIGGF